jgi:hypothetical protein
MSLGHNLFEQQVFQRAFALWKHDGCPEGLADEYYERALELVLEEDPSGVTKSRTDER